LDLTALDNTLYFTANINHKHFILLRMMASTVTNFGKSNGSSATTQLVKNLDNDYTSSYSLYFTATGNEFFYFTAVNGINGREE